MARFHSFPSNNINGGIQYKFKASNGYGASIVRHSFSYGREQGLWKLAVIGKDGHLCYDTPITDDVLGNLTDEDVDEIITQIEALPEEKD
jgi:hypothetical protein